MALLRRQLGEVRGILDGLAAIVAAHMSREDVATAVGDADLAVGGDEGERFLDEVMRNRVVIEVEADVRRLAGGDGADHVAFEGMLWQRQEARALLVERV